MCLYYSYYSLPITGIGIEPPGGFLGCQNESSCHCYQATCYDVELAYCSSFAKPCMGCNRDHCCCCESSIELCDCDDDCMCLEEDQSCGERGMKYCEPGQCGRDCPGYKCCCESKTFTTMSIIGATRERFKY